MFPSTAKFGRKIRRAKTKKSNQTVCNCDYAIFSVAIHGYSINESIFLSGVEGVRLSDPIGSGSHHIELFRQHWQCFLHGFRSFHWEAAPVFDNGQRHFSQFSRHLVLWIHLSAKRLHFVQSIGRTIPFGKPESRLHSNGVPVSGKFLLVLWISRDGLYKFQLFK